MSLGGENYLIVACADGAGSADHSEIGARLAVETFLDEAEGQLSRIAGSDVLPDLSVVGDWAKTGRAAIFAESKVLGISSRQMACTLLAVIAGPSWTVFLQIGDGAIVCDSEDGYQYAFWPDSGEYANSTRFLTDPKSEDHLHLDYLGKPVSEVPC